MILHHTNVFFIADDTILKRPSENTDSLENLSQGYKIDYIL